MVKRKFKDIEKDDGKKESPPPQRSKRQKKVSMRVWAELSP